MKKVIYILLVSLFFACNSRSKEVVKIAEPKIYKIENSEIIDLKNKISDLNEVQSSHIGAGGTPSLQYQNFKKLTKIATEEDLILLSKDTNKVVRTYAAFGLIEKKSKEVANVFSKSLKTQHKVITIDGCIEREKYISDEIYSYYWNKVRLGFEDEFTALQNDSMLLKLDSLILINNNAGWLLYSRAFNNRIYPKSYDSIIKNKAIKEQNFDGIEYLYRNNLQDNKEQIIKVLLELLKDDTTTIYYNEILFEMLLSFKIEKLNTLVLKKISTEKKLKIYTYLLRRYGLVE